MPSKLTSNFIPGIFEFVIFLHNCVTNDDRLTHAGNRLCLAGGPGQVGGRCREVLLKAFCAVAAGLF